MSLLDIFEKEVEVEYDGETYLVRDNGSVLRKNQYRKKARRSDNIWTFGKQNISSGYMFISGVRVHRLVCLAFHGFPKYPDLVVDHIDTNRANNRPENLRWVTRLENILLNPITLQRIQYSYGSIEAFFEDPSKPLTQASNPNISWMRAVSKDEAKETLNRLEEWARVGTLPKGGSLGDWIHSNRSKLLVREPSEANPESISKQIKKWEEQGVLRSSSQSYRPEPEQIYFESYSPLAIQVRWRTKTEFPQCPSMMTSTSLSDYVEALKFGAVFSKNQFGDSLVVQARLIEDSEENNAYVLTGFKDTDSQVKPWGLVHLTTDDEFIYHNSLGLFFTLQGALKEFCKMIGEPFEESVDDYTR